MDRMSSVSKNPREKFPLDELQELERLKKLESYPHHFWEAQGYLLFSFFPQTYIIIEESDTSILYIHTPFIVNTRNGYSKW